MCLVINASLPRPGRDATSLQEVEAERPDEFEHAVQGGLVELAGDDGYLVVVGHFYAGEPGECGVVELTGDPDFIHWLSFHRGRTTAHFLVGKAATYLPGSGVRATGFDHDPGNQDARRRHPDWVKLSR
jgi:hypothetical protein